MKPQIQLPSATFWRRTGQRADTRYLYKSRWETGSPSQPNKQWDVYIKQKGGVKTWASNFDCRAS